jgi:hypothetical protein
LRRSRSAFLAFFCLKNTCKKPAPVCDAVDEGRSGERTSNWRQTPPAPTNGRENKTKK